MINNIIEQILQDTIANKIKNNKVYCEAFTHKSYTNENNLSYSYERLEFLGDAIIGFRVANFLYTRYPNMDEGELTSLRSKVVRKETLAAAAYSLNLSQFMLLGKGEKNTQGRDRFNKLADAFESFIAAVYLDLGLNAVDQILNLNLYEWIINNSFDNMIDYKTKLQEYVQNGKKEMIHYELISHSKINNVNNFVVGAFLDEVLMGTGIGHSKKSAEQEAAKIVLEKLSVL